MATQHHRREGVGQHEPRAHAPSGLLGFLLGVGLTLLATTLQLPTFVSDGGGETRNSARADSADRPAPASEARPPPPASRSGRAITINWVGDTVLGSRYGLPPNSARNVFASVAPTLRRADLTIGNLEGTFSVGGESKCGATASEHCFAFQAPPENAAALRDAGFDMMNLANNHAFDYGPDGQRQTIRALDRVHIRHVGRPAAVTRVNVRGNRVAVIGFAPYRWATSLTDIPAARSLVNRAAHDADIVIVIMHAGGEGADRTHTPEGVETEFGEDRGYARGFAHAVIDGGADIVLGSGPHVIRGLETHRGRLIAYSLGNFAGHHNFGTGGALSASGILHVQLSSRGRPLTGRWVSVKLTGAGTPVLDATNESARLVAELSRADFGADGVEVTSGAALKFEPAP